MTQFQIPLHLFVCEVDGKHVFLDLVRDRYFRLPDAENRAFAALAKCGGEGPDTPDLEPLIRAGVLVPFPHGKPIAATTHPLPVSSLVETADAHSRARLIDVAEVTMLVSGGRRTVRRKALPTAFAKLSQCRSDVQGSPIARDRLLRRFIAARHLVPIARNCLYDSLALRQFLARRHVPAGLVIGVKLHPFGAHCWLQDGTAVLNDALGGARDFQPVLVA